jgi:hypothetical protein
MAAFGGAPDIEATAPNDQVWTHCDHGLDSNPTAQQRSCRPSWLAIIGLEARLPGGRRDSGRPNAFYLNVEDAKPAIMVNLNDLVDWAMIGGRLLLGSRDHEAPSHVKRA